MVRSGTDLDLGHFSFAVPVPDGQHVVVTVVHHSQVLTRVLQETMRGDKTRRQGQKTRTGDKERRQRQETRRRDKERKQG